MLRSDRAGARSSGVAPTVSVGRSQISWVSWRLRRTLPRLLAERVAGLALDLVDPVDQVLERAELHDPLGRGLLADAGDGGQVVARVAAQGGEVRVLGRGQPVLLDQGGGVVALHVGHAAAVVEHGHVVVDELEGVAVAGDDEDVVARRAGLRGEGGDDVVGLVAGGGQVADAERVQHLEDEADLAAELVRGLRPAGLVLDVLLVPEGRLGPVEGHRDPGRLLVPQDVDEHRGEAVDGVGGLARRGREVLHREREERPVRQRVPVEQQEPVSHVPDPMTARRCPAALCGCGSRRRGGTRPSLPGMCGLKRKGQVMSDRIVGRLPEGFSGCRSGCEPAVGRVFSATGSATRRRYEIVINTRLATLRCQTGC